MQCHILGEDGGEGEGGAVGLLHAVVLYDTVKNGSSACQEVKLCLPCHVCSSNAATAEGM